MNKPLKDWTLAEIKEYCRKRTEELGDNEACCESCDLGIACCCCLPPNEWMLEPKLKWKVTYECPRCSYIVSQPFDKCPRCDAEMEV